MTVQRTISVTIGQWVTEAAGRAGGAPWNVAGSATSGSALDCGSDELAGRIQRLVDGSPAPVCVVMRNSVRMVELWFALAKCGIIEVPLNVHSGTMLLSYLIRDTGAELVVCDEEFASSVIAALVDVPAVRQVLINGDRPPGIEPGSGVNVSVWADLLPQPFTSVAVEPDDIATVLYTSGTTGPPKGVRLSHRFNLNLARFTTDLMRYTAADRLFSVFPLFHSNARYTSLMPALESGAGLVMHNKFSASRFWDICRAEGITAFNYQGAMMAILDKQPERPDDSDNPVRVAFGAPCPADVWPRFEARFGVVLTEIYGSTEVSNVVVNRPTARRIGAGGLESPHYSVRVVDHRDRPVGIDVPGEIVVRPKDPGWIFSGYHGRPEATVQAWRNLWYHTGDRGRVDHDGFLFFLDRMSDSIRRRGENISTWEIERVLTEHAAVVAVAAYAVTSELSEDEVMVSVIPVPGQRPEPTDLVDFCRDRLTSFAIPRFIRFVAELPMTPSQRIEKYRLRAVGVTDDTFDTEAGGRTGPAR